MVSQKSVFRSAIEGEDGQVDAGYLGLYVVMCTTMGAAVAITLAGMYSVYIKPDTAAAVIQAIGVAIVSCGTAFGASAGAVGLFRMGDKPHAGTTTTTVAATATETTTKGA